VFRNGAQIGTPATTSFSDTTAAPGTTYNYTVAAVDAAGNASVQSAGVPATTPGGQTTSGVTLHGSSFAANLTASSLTIPAPAGAQPGDVEVMAIAARGAPTLTAPAGWTLVRQDANGTTMRQTIYTHVVGTGEPASYTWTWSTAQAAAGGILAYGGVSTVTPVNVSGGQANVSATSVTAPSVTTTKAGAQLVGFFGTGAATTFTAPGGMTEQGDVASSAGTFKVTLEGADVPRPAAGATGTAAAKAANAAANVGQLVALAP